MSSQPESVGGFELLRKLGSGGFGSVYLGQDADGRQAAVKLLHRHLADDPKVRDLFARELTAARKIQGFCLAEILDADPGADQPWIATEFVDGPTLQDAVREHGPRTGADLQRLAVQTATALCAIHAAGVVHRDLKPDNIMLAAEGPRVIDFGVARAVEGSGVTSATMVGTAGFMAPEQLDGHRLTPAADVFAWAVVMVFAATGKYAFPGESNMARIARVLTGTPDTEGVPEPLLATVLPCLEKDPAGRPTARQVLDALLTGQAPRLGAEPRPSPAESPPAAAAPQQASPGPAAQAPTGPAGPPPSAPVAAPTPPAGSASAADWSARLADDPRATALIDPHAALDRFNRDAESARQGEDPAAFAAAFLGQGDALVRLERYTDAERRYQQAEQAIHADGNATAPLDLGLDIRAKLGRADAALGLGRLGEADFAYQHAESLARQATIPDFIARCCNGRGRVAALRAELIAADPYFKDALVWATQAGHPLTQGEALLGRSHVMMLVMRYAKGGTLAEQAQTLGEQVGAHHLVAEALYLRSIAAWQAGHLQQAEEQSRQAAELAQEIQLGSIHAEALSVWAMLAIPLNRTADAVPAAEHAAAIAEQLEEPSVRADVLFNLGKVYRKTGRKQQAKQVLDRALSIAESIGMKYTYEARWDRLLTRVLPW